MDNCIESNTPVPVRPKETTSVQLKRVHFSVDESKVDTSKYVAASPEPEIVKRKENNYTPDSAYSNEYELIETFDNYLDMKSKGQKFSEIRKTPPVLPPKPANLIKLQQISKQKMLQTLGKPNSSKADSSESEPDYCSIGEIQEISKSIKIVAEIHEIAPSDHYAAMTSNAAQNTSVNLEESFADVPKLPNVAEIISPKASDKIFNQENYIIKTPVKNSNIDLAIKQLMRKSENAMGFIDKSPNKLVHKTPYLMPKRRSGNNDPKHASANVPVPVVDTYEEKNKLVAEFDWYNLDAEYENEKKVQPVVIHETLKRSKFGGELQRNSVKYNLQPDDQNGDPDVKIEYNLDMEYRMCSQPDTVLE
jgi:hypothetical protein